MSFGRMYCEVYGCLHAQKPGATVTVAIEGEPKTIKICEEHVYFFSEQFNAEVYAIGLTFRGEVEVRPIPAQPTTPPEEE